MKNFRINPGLAACLLILIIPAFLNIRETHDWGGDFALYIQQARNILLNLPQLQTGFIYTKEMAYVAPPAYPVGLPLLLVPVYFFFGKSIYHFSLLISFFYLLFSWMAFSYFRRISKDLLTALTLTLLLVCNPWMISFKRNILSDLPFALFCLLYLDLGERSEVRRPARVLLRSFSLGAAILIRMTGLALLISSVLWIFVLLVRRCGDFKSHIKEHLLTTALGVSLWLLVSRVLIPVENIETYAGMFSLLELKRIVGENLIYYQNVLKDIVPNFGPNSFRDFLWHLLVVGVPLGAILKVRRKGIEQADVFALVYLLLILSFRGQQGFRYVIPLAPLILTYFFLALTSVTPLIFSSPKGRWRAHAVIGAYILLTTARPLYHIQHTVHEVLDGPQAPSAQEAFRAVDRLPSTSLTAFSKSTVLVLYTSRSAIPQPDAWLSWTDADLWNYYRKYGITHVLTDKKYPSKYADYVEQDRNRSVLIWSNARFSLLEINP